MWEVETNSGRFVTLSGYVIERDGCVLFYQGAMLVGFFDHPAAVVYIAPQEKEEPSKDSDNA